MNSKTLLPICITLLSLSTPLFPHIEAKAGAAPERPNIVVILADDLGYGDVGCNGCQDIPTPNIDRMAREGVRFEQGYVTHPYCSPSRAGLMSGRAQARFGHDCNPDPGPGRGLPVTEVLLPAKLKQAGYVSGLVGKWHLGDEEKYRPLARGFDEFFGFLGGGFSYFGQSKGPVSDENSILRGKARVDPKEITYLTDNFSREAADFIGRHRERPFFLYLAYNAPHAPNQATPKYLNRVSHLDGKRKAYAALVSGLDEGVGVVLDALKQSGVDGKTLVFFLSDNGGRADGANNHPLRAIKGSTFEGGIRVPFLARWPGRLPAGKTWTAPVSSLDIHATALSLAGITGAATGPIEGIDLMPSLSGSPGPAQPRTLFWRVWSGWDFALREGNWKLVKPGWTDQAFLYDLSKDVGERNDLSVERAADKERLLAQWRQWNRANVPQLWGDAHKANVAREKQEGRLD